MKVPLFSVITCTHNRKLHLDGCLKSLKSQTCKDFEHIIIDGNSNDGTYQLVKDYQKNTKDYPIKIYQFEPKGVSNAFNNGIRKSKGKYVIFLNSDDYFINNKVIENIKSILKIRPDTDWLQCKSIYDYSFINLGINSRLISKPFFYLNLSYNCPVSHQATVLKKTKYIENGMFDESMYTHMDTDLYYKLHKDTKILFTDKPLIAFRCHKQSVSAGFSPIQLFTFLYPILYKKYRNIPIISGIKMTIKYGRNLEYIN